ncbi:hypothetical protein [Bradyrhizobium sp. 195]|uniref:hypothetical protein n=1 Tax=Bradyrhizobium sp. 195 TaxID=2782662 RepID=UPI002001A7FA|nr:hypothetical protein [Bradyrhizobium sp. 195]
MSRQTAMPESGYRHNRQRRPQLQMDLFGSGLSNGGIGAPAWPELLAEARAALTSLMTQLMLDHAAMTATPPAKESIMISGQGQASSSEAQGDSLRAPILGPSAVAQSREQRVAIRRAGPADGARVVIDRSDR